MVQLLKKNILSVICGVVVILAIVSMSRGPSRTDTHVDVDRRP